jgi:hypothetical protein
VLGAGGASPGAASSVTAAQPPYRWIWPGEYESPVQSQLRVTLGTGLVASELQPLVSAAQPPYLWRWPWPSSVHLASIVVRTRPA